MGDEIKFAFVGDTMCGDSFDQLGMGVAASLDRYGVEFLSPEIINTFSGHDMVLCNVECVLSDIGRKENSLRSLHMRGRPKTANYLEKWGLTVAHVANNHILEQGIEAAIDTVQQLEKAGIKTVGTGKSGCFQEGVSAIEMNFGNQLVAVVGACFHDGKYAFNNSMEDVVQAVREQASMGRLVIVSVHWGDEWIDRPSLRQRQMARELMDAGASLVVGHHPHVVQGIDTLGDSLVAYSLGNFIFDGDLEAAGWSIILSVTIAGRSIKKWEAIPIVRSKGFRPIIANGERKDELDREIIQRCNLARQGIPDKEDYAKKYLLELKTLETKFRRRLWLNIIQRSFRYRPIYLPQILWRPVQRRLGIW